MTVLHFDWESKSTCDLKARGLHNYATHPGTDIWCGAWAFDDEEPEVWFPGVPCPPRIRAHVETGGIVFGHNVIFEWHLWNEIAAPRYGWPKLAISQCRCTMARCYAMALPGGLERAAAAFGIQEQKDMAGHRLMLQMSKPRSENPLVWWDDIEKILELAAYCKQDLRTERGVEKRTMPLSQDEQWLWELDAVINSRGVGIDQKSVTLATAIVLSEKTRLDKEIRDVTGGFVSVCSEVKRLGDWIRSQGVAIDGLAKADVLDALRLDDLPGPVRMALLLRQEAGKTSTAKLKAMTEAASSDGRIRGTLQYHGAGTGRWAGRRVQMHNLPRPKMKFPDIEDAIKHFDSREYLDVFYDRPLNVISNCLRSMVVAAEGSDLLAADFANIEGRGLAWLAGETRKLKVFRDNDEGRGPDPYLVAAADIFHVPVSTYNEDSPERQTGKVSELSLGYQGGLGAFRQMEKNFGIDLGLSDAKVHEVKDAWRAAHPKIVQYWHALEAAALGALLHAGQTFSVGASKFKVSGSFLWLLLPSGRALCYPYPSVKPLETPWGEMKDQVHYMTVDGTSNKWVETNSYGGKWAENITQAICRDLLVYSIRAAEAANYPVVLHVHDEVVSEVPKNYGSLKEFEALCSQTPAWARGLPVVAKGWRGERYRK